MLTPTSCFGGVTCLCISLFPSFFPLGVLAATLDLNATLPDGECEGSEVMGADNGKLRNYMILSTAVM